MPTDMDRNITLTWTRAGIAPERICKRLGCTKEQLVQAFPLELGYTDEEDLAMVAGTAFTMAISGENATMTKFWLEAKGGAMWKGESSGQGSGEGPLKIVMAEGVEQEELPNIVEDGEFTEVDDNETVDDSSSV